MNGKRIFKTLTVTAALVSVLAFSADQALADRGRAGAWGGGTYSPQASPWNQGGTFIGRSGFGGGTWGLDRRVDRPMVVAPPRVVHRPPVIVPPPHPGCRGPVFVERPVVHRPSWPTIGLNIVINLLR
ncbi:MAG TPA: hypothetical protein PKG77_14295 [Phycisphaerae bacterium]|nr:hypothetical protein [Phycisphaerae bacterium]HQL75010.1 hypothetical protein [Phycisphaerae bacterium]